MKRFLTATCIAAACAVGLAAQSTGTTGSSSSTEMQNPQGGRGGPRTVTGCLRAGDTEGTYMLTDIQMQGMNGGSSSTTAGSTSGSTSGSTAGTSSSGTMSGGQGRGMQSLTLNAGSDVDLKAHVGHKIEVTGTMAGGRRGGGGGDTSSTANTGTSGSTAGSSSNASTTGNGQGRGGMRTMNVTSVRMISDSCS